MALPETRHLRAFAAVARHLNFHRAAGSLNVSQPALSQTIRQLESLLGTPLLARTTRAVRLTGAGQQFLAIADRLLATLEDAVTDLQRTAAVRSAVMTVAAMPSVARQVVLPAFERMRGGEPVRLALRDAYLEDILQWVRAGEVEFGVTALAAPVPDLHVEPLLDSPLRLVVAPGHRLAAGARWRDLLEEPFVVVSRRSSTHQIVSSTFAAIGRFPPRSTEVQSAETAACLAARGHGVTVLPEIAVGELAHLGVVGVRLTHPERHSRVHRLRRPGVALAPAAQRFWTLLGARR